MSAGLAATQLALSREHRLAALGALATAAAHELGTPLGTIAVVARELERALPREFARSRRRAAAARPGRALPRHPRAPRQSRRSDARRDRAPAARRAARRHRRALSRRGCRDRDRDRQSGAPQPQVWRAPELLHGLGNIIENAADFARSARARPGALGTTPRSAHLGGGRRPRLRARNLRAHRRALHHLAARPSTRWAKARSAPAPTLGQHEGMGLGFFIAKTLLEQTGGTVKARQSAEAAARASAVAGRAA